MAAATNRRTVTLAGESFEVEASVRAEGVYVNEFAGRLDAPYSGIFEDDILCVFNRSQRTTTARVKAGRGGRPHVGRDGRYVPVTEGGVNVEVPNPDYRGIDGEGLIRLAWAMGMAAGSLDEPWQTPDGGGFQRMLHAPVSVHELLDAYTQIVSDLGGNCIFRNPTRHADVPAGDDGQRVEGDAAD